MKAPQTNYNKSNAIVTVTLNVFDKKYYNNIITCGDTPAKRQIAAQQLIDYLCGKFGIVSVPVVVKNTFQPHRTNDSGRLARKTLGRYWHAGFIPVKIEIWNKTAIKQQTISNKVFADTLLHEFMHHYDTCKLKLDTIHSAGFYKRISDLQSKLAA